MVKKIFNLFNKEISSVHNAAFLLGFFALISQVLALFRDKLLAYYFGAGTSLDIYYSAFKIPDFIFITVASLVSVSVLVPFIIKTEDRGEGSSETKKFVDSIVTFFILLIVVVSAIAFILSPYILPKIFPGFSLAELTELTTTTRILLLSPILLGISNIFGAITQAYNRFLLYALSPVAYNIGIIIGILFFADRMGVIGVAWGVVLGACLHVCIQIPGVISQGLFPKLKFHINFPQIKEVLKLSLPRTFTLASSQIALIVFTSFASLMAAGSIAVFNFSFNLQSVPLSIVGVSYSLAAFPTLARLYKEKNMDRFISQIATALRHIIFWSIPVSVYFIVLRAQIIRVVLGSGNFTWNDTRLTAACLGLFSISVVAQGAILLLVRSFYASGRTKLPLIMNAIGMVTSVILAYVFYQMYMRDEFFTYFIQSILRISDIRGGEVVVLALAYSIGSILNFIILWIVFEKEVGSLWKYVKKALLHSLGGALIGGSVAYAMLNFLVGYIVTDTMLGIFTQGFIAGIVGIMVNITVLHVLNNIEQKEIMATLHRKIWKTETIITDSEVV